MAAGLPSFQSNDKQMQAIRELTNEVFNLKQKISAYEQSTNTAIQNIVSNLISFRFLTRELTEPVTIQAGQSATITRIITTASSVVKNVWYANLVDSNNMLIDVLNVYGWSYSTAAAALSIYVKNETESDITVSKVGVVVAETV